MRVNINLRNLRDPWKHTKDDSFECYWKGNMFIRNRLIEKKDLRDFFSSENINPEHPSGELIKFLHELNGCYSFIIETPQYILGVVDRIRSIPLFYASMDTQVTISDNAECLQEQLQSHFCEENGAEFLIAGYVTGPDTLFEKIQQIQAGEYLIYKKSDSDYFVHPYFQYLHGKYSDEPEEHLIKRLDDVMAGAFNRLIDTTIKQGKTIVVPLSGGLDSRLVVAMLKRLGVSDVICFSYGVKGNRESEMSRLVAEALGYPWLFVEYSKKGCYECFHSDEMLAYQKYASNLTSIPTFQDYLAVKILKQKGKIPDNAVIVPGHTGDMISGGHIPHNIEDIPKNHDQFVSYTMQRHYIYWKWNNCETNRITKILQDRIQKSGGNIRIHDAESLANAIEYFNFNQRQAKFIINSVRVYEFFGYEWRIPLWDRELIEFFLKIPLKYRINQNLYKKYAVDCVFVGDLKALREIDCTKPIKNKTDEIFLHTVLNNLLDRYYYTFNRGLACIEKYPNFSRIRDRLLGHPYNNYPKYPLISEILDYTHKNKSLPLGNGIVTLEYLDRLMNNGK